MQGQGQDKTQSQEAEDIWFNRGEQPHLMALSRNIHANYLMSLIQLKI